MGKLLEAFPCYVCTAAVALQFRLSIACASCLAATCTCFGMFGYKHYAMVFLGSCFMLYKKYDDIVAVVRYI